MWRSVQRFFRTPKGVLTIILAVLLLTAAPGEGPRTVAVTLAAAVLAAGSLDVLVRRWKFGLWEYPSGAVLTAAIVVMVLRAQEPWYVATVASALAVASKYIFRSRGANVFNPAALGLIVAYYLFHAGHSWWGAQADVVAWLDHYRANALAFLLLIGTGFCMTNRVNKAPLVLTFLGTYFALFTATAYATHTLAALNLIAEVFHGSDYEAALYFAFFMLTDPPTSPPRYRDQIYCGIVVAGASYVCFEWTRVVYYLLAGGIAGNLWEAWRRLRVYRTSTATASAY